MRRLAGALTVLATLVGLGLELGGFRVEWLGWLLIGLGLAAFPLILLGPPLFRRIAVSLVRTAQAQGAVAAREQAGEREVGDRQLRAAIQQVIGELNYNRKMLERARDTNTFWNTDRLLVASMWHQHYGLLAGEKDLEDAYRLVEDAYQEIDRVNHASKEAANVTVEGFEGEEMFGPGVVRKEDRLSDAIDAVDVARSALTGCLSRLR
jgi:hypothetical protein